MKDKILLIRPPTVMKGTSFIATQFPINIAGLGASLIVNGYDVYIWDFDAENFDGPIFEKNLKALSPAVAGISCYTPTIINGHRIAEAVKRCMPAVRTVVGGPHVSALPEETLKEFSGFDIGVMGEGEEVMPEMIRRLLKKESLDGLAGVVYRTDDGLIKNNGRRAAIRDLDKLPFPARHLLNISLYKGQSHRGFSRDFLKITEIMTSRGCPNRCIFCASDVVMDKGVRFRSSASVKEEIGECAGKYGFNHFAISDDTFTLKEDRLYEICEEFARRKLTWNCNARVWPFSKKTASMMARCGCEGITFGVESGSPRILGLIKKNANIQQVEDAFRWSKESGIKLVEADVIIGGHPSETTEDIDMTRRLLDRISPDIIMASVVVPYPGTELYKIMKMKSQILNDKKWDSFVLYGKEPSWKTDNFSPKDLLALQRKILRNFYFRPLYILRIMKKMRSVKEFFYWIYAGLEFLFHGESKKPVSGQKEGLS